MTDSAIDTDLQFDRDLSPSDQRILTPEAVNFLQQLVMRFSEDRGALLYARLLRQQKLDAGELPDFESETISIRDSEWEIRGIPDELRDRRVEITGPPDRKMVINALNANVNVFMADFEDSLAPRGRS
jgi:Malate synthase